MESLAVVGPIDLGLLTGQSAKAQVRLGRASRSESRHDGAEVIGGAGVTTGTHHLVQACGGERGVLLQGLDDEGDEGVGDGGAHRLSCGG